MAQLYTLGVPLATQDLPVSDDQLLAEGALVTVASRGATGIMQLVTQVLVARLVACAAASLLTTRHEGLIIETHHGYFEKQGQEDDSVIELINEFRPELLLVGFGMPLQELWIATHQDRLRANAILSVGGLFGIISGSTPRPPKWLTDRGWEWLFRLIREPRRLGRRYLIGNPRFMWIVLRQKLGWHKKI